MRFLEFVRDLPVLDFHDVVDLGVAQVLLHAVVGEDGRGVIIEIDVAVSGLRRLELGDLEAHLEDRLQIESEGAARGRSVRERVPDHVDLLQSL